MLLTLTTQADGKNSLQADYSIIKCSAPTKEGSCYFMSAAPASYPTDVPAAFPAGTLALILNHSKLITGTKSKATQHCGEFVETKRMLFY